MKATKKTKQLPAQIPINHLIHEVRGQRVMLDSDLAALYGVETFTLNRAVKRNIERFPEDFMFRLNTKEWKNLISQIAISSCQTVDNEPNLIYQIGISSCETMDNDPNLRSQIVTSSAHGGRRKLPLAFTEHGILMLSSVLNSKIAVEINIEIMRVFMAMRRYAVSNSENSAQIAELRKLLMLYIEKNDKRVNDIIMALNSLIAAPPPPPKPLIGFRPNTSVSNEEQHE